MLKKLHLPPNFYTSMDNKVTEIMAENAETTALIVRDFELTTPEKPMNEAELLDYLANVVAYMIENRLDYLLSLLYRLDVAEDKINRALMPGNAEDANVAVEELLPWQSDCDVLLEHASYGE